MDVKRIIAESYLAAGFTDEFMDRVAAISEIRQFGDGDSIVHEDDETADLMILAEGKAEIVRITGDTIAYIKPNMPFGEVAFLDHKRRSSSVIAKGDCKVVVIPEEPLREMLRAEPEMAVRALINLSSLLCERLRKANQQIAALNAIEEFQR
ncbi:MAG: cyclic nucleotide-binding domain-containing protein [Armatimonadetes bacterium]|nr:cyclic nucleotide-binding domain-containing protein [Armatimonadota bacterium]MBS1728578.1 cyclic nucleotide-binding domain-containing protein [Armatimonadota bacterium]